MKILPLILTAFSVGISAFAVPYWIVGDHYIGYSRDAKQLELNQNVIASSWGFDEQNCQLWVSDDISHQLLSYSKRSAPVSIAAAEKILSDVQFGHFLTLSAELKLNVRDSQGAIIATTEAPWAKSALQILTTNNGGTWTLHQDSEAKRLWIEGRDAHWRLTKKIDVSQGADLWGNTRLRMDPIRKNLWIGYARTSVSHVYQTFVRRYDFQGELIQEHTWNNRGLFFDSCLADAELGNLLAARDVPHPGFTVPVYSYLELVPLLGKSVTALALETNEFVDSLLCQPHRIDFIARSIFSSERPKLMSWNPQSTAKPEKLFDLPSKASQLYACNVE